MSLYEIFIADLQEQISQIAQQHVDITFCAWLFWLWWPFILVTVILPTLIVVLLYVSASIVHIYKLRQYFRFRELLASDVDFKIKARTAVSWLWECHGWIWHSYEIVGFENLPANKRALVVYYHGVVPVDYYYLSSRYFIKHKRTIWTIAAEFLFKTPGLRLLMEVVQATPGTVKQIADLLNNEEIVSVAPGGIREAQFSDEYYELVWNGHLGFAKAACAGRAPIIPVFTQNIREAYRTSPFFRGLFRKIYERTKLPLLPIFGGFPVKLTTYIGKPIPYDPNATPEEVAEKTADAIRNLIKQHQRLPGSIVRGMLDRIEVSSNARHDE